MQPLTGDTQLRGSLDVGSKVEVRRDLLVGGTKDAHSITVQSFDGPADVLVASGGAADATLLLKSPAIRLLQYLLLSTMGPSSIS